MPADDPFADLGVTLGARGGELKVWSASATSLELCLFDDRDATWVAKSIPMTRGPSDVWAAHSKSLAPGMRYSVRASGPTEPGDAFDPELHLIDPYARGLARTSDGDWRGYVQEPDAFDWGSSRKPAIGWDHTIVYELHVKGMSRQNLDLPEELRGTYAGIAHESTIGYLDSLGITTVELLPVQQFVSEQRLVKQGLANYWGYNTLNFFTPHAGYATREAQFGGTGAVLREFKTMVRRLHEAGIEVILDVVYNHTAEESLTGPTTSLRGIDNRNYYRQNPDGEYIDVTGCGNSLNTATPAAARLVLDSLAYWFTEVQVDGFRFDLAVTLARDAEHDFRTDHPLITAIRDDPRLSGAKLIAEPWDVGMGGWQVGRFPPGWTEWNDGYRDRARDFWLTDVGTARQNGSAPNGIGSFARRLAGSAHVFSHDRGPTASLNFITAHDGFTMADLTAYTAKHNLGNGEMNRDGSDHNHSFDFGVEGPSDDQRIRDDRCRAMRNLMGTLVLSAGVPMITAGDEYGRSQRGNNNAYNQDSDLTWMSWDREDWQQELVEVTRTLIRLRRENPALRPVHFGRAGETVPSATQMDWYNKDGVAMSERDWDSPGERTLQYLAASTPEFEAPNRILLVIHGLEEDVTVRLPRHEGVSFYRLLWDSSLGDAARDPRADGGAIDAGRHVPDTELRVAATSMQLFLAG